MSMLFTRPSFPVIRGLLLPDRLTAEVVGARRLQSATTQRAQASLIQRSMFQQTAKRLRWFFMIIEITPVRMCCSIFTWRNPLMVVLTGNPTSGLLLYQPMPRWRRSRPLVTCLAIIWESHKLPDQPCRLYRYGLIPEPAIPIRLLLVPGLRLTPTSSRHGKRPTIPSPKCPLLLFVPRRAILTATAKITNLKLLPEPVRSTIAGSRAPGRSWIFPRDYM